MMYLSGVISTADGQVITGLAGKDRSVEDGYKAARACVLMILAILRDELGSLSKVAEVVMLNGYVNAAPGFNDSPEVINGASDLLVQVFGEAGRHARAALGLSALPRNALVEVQMSVRVKD
jgi:enamine deaminase RidA (YjgF/YER057c/UK114 family)